MRGGELPTLTSRPQDMRVLELMMAALWGFLIGGLFADRLVYAVQVLGAGVALGTYVATFVWLYRYRDRDLPLVLAIGSAIGACFGAVVLIADAIAG